MTRINLVPPSELSTRHLVAEYRELPRIFSNVRTMQANDMAPKIPETYRLGEGHMTFFYDKLGFLLERQQALIDEMKHRGFTVTYDNPVTLTDDLDPKWFGCYTPTPEALALNRKRISERS